MTYGSTVALIGMPRSGTTWIAKIFDSHPATIYRHEPDMGCMADGFIGGNIPVAAPLSEAERLAPHVDILLDQMARNRSARTNGKQPFFAKHHRNPLTFKLRAAIAIGVKAASQLYPGLQIPDLINRRRRAEVTLVWKSIYLTDCLGVIASNSNLDKAVLILRHPCGQINSVLRGEAGGQFQSNRSISEDYGVFVPLLKTETARSLGLTIAGLRQLHPVERLAWQWVLKNEKAVTEARQLENCTITCYEDVCAKPVQEVKRLFDFVGLDWNAQTEKFILSSTSGAEDRYYSIRKSPLVAANKWRQEMPPDDIERIMKIVERGSLSDFFPAIDG